MRDTTKELNQVIAAAYAGKKLHLLAGKVLQLQTADKFRLAAALLDLGMVDLAVSIGARALQEIELARLFGKPSSEAPPADQPHKSHMKDAQMMSGGEMTPVPKDHPLMIAWDAYKATEDYANTRTWAGIPAHVDGSLWAAFEQGFRAALSMAPPADQPEEKGTHDE